jgi:DNA polymerase III subunit chi
MPTAFYHLTETTVIEALPRLIARAQADGHTVKITTASAASAKALDAALWTHDPGSFLPHCLADDPAASQTPVVISADPHSSNEATVQIIVDGAAVDDSGHWQKSLVLFDGQSDDEVTAARALWRNLKAIGIALTYWQQTESGWTQKGAE